MIFKTNYQHIKVLLIYREIYIFKIHYKIYFFL